MQSIFDDLCCRFIINLPQTELAIPERVCFQAELAHWFYEDFYREEDPSLPSLPFRTFCLRLFQHCPSLRHYLSNWEDVLKRFIEYKTQVPVCGAIILNPTLTKCLMVKGWKATSTWGFPKGKINQDESKSSCAIREVQEEIGFDISPYLKEEDYIEYSIFGQQITLYIIQGIHESTPFAPQTRKEISDIAWHSMDLLVSVFKNNHYTGSLGKIYYMVKPAILKLTQFIKSVTSSKKPRGKRVELKALFERAMVNTNVRKNPVSKSKRVSVNIELPNLVSIFNIELQKRTAMILGS
jgi:8-oxo-dGTP pyrophosphatase MutT (NUDIX family)